MKFYPLITLFLLTLTSVSHANLLKLSVEAYNGSTPSLVDALVSQMEDDLNSDLPNADASNYLTGMANAGAFAAKGMGTDYANDIDLFLFGVNLGAGLDVGDGSLGSISAEDAQGFGVNGSILFGMNLGVFDLPTLGEWFDPNKLRVFVNLLPPGLVEENTTDKEYELGHFGVHARYPLFEGIEVAPFGLFSWGGVYLHAGLEQTSLKYVMKKQQNQSGSLDAGVTYTATGPLTIGAEVSSFSIPIEISTSAQFGYIFSLYTGLGMDISSSSATSITALNMTANLNGVPGGNPTLKADLDAGQEGDGDAFSARYFAGLQINAPLWKPIYINFNGGLGSGLYALSAGTKFTW